MKDDFTHIAIVLDRSGSMSKVQGDTIGGFNAFVKEQKAAPGHASLTLVQFDNEYDIVYQSTDIQQVPDLTGVTYVPRGSTALHDAIGQTIVKEGQWLASMAEENRPGKVLVVIMTDGHENASQEYGSARIREMIQEQTEKYSWQFVFIGANQDAALSGENLGIARGNTMSYAATPEGTTQSLSDISAGTVRYRSAPDRQTRSFFNPDEKKEKKEKTPAGATK